jgi:hypothetical protein
MMQSARWRKRRLPSQFRQVAATTRLFFLFRLNVNDANTSLITLLALNKNKTQTIYMNKIEVNLI